MMIRSLLAGLALLCSTAATAAPLRIACVGNSITYGDGIENRDRNSYPAQLQNWLGDAYEVRNFGVCGTTLLTRGDFPYVTTPEYQASLDFRPDLVLIKLGTNDSNLRNRDKLAQEYIRDYKTLIETYRSLPSSPRIVVMTPVKAYTDEHISDSVIRRIIPMIEQVAFETGADIINLYNLFPDEFIPELMPDRVHPSSVGAEMMARRIARWVESQDYREPSEVPGPDWGTPQNFHGYPMYEPEVEIDGEGVTCRIVLPREELPGKPWVLRARFWDFEPQTDIALLEAGYHLAYCDVADLYGSPKAVRRWDRFYNLMQMSGFSEKVVLEGMSRGGLIVYNWAAQHPGRVAAIYADAPVMDIKSWPMGSGGSGRDTDLMQQAYGFGSWDEAQQWQQNPVDHAAVIARSGIPLLHIVGTEDEAVPVAENTHLFAQRYSDAGGEKMTIILKPGVGHHPHSLRNPDPIVDFILGATDYRHCFGLHAASRTLPSTEYTPAAEWHSDREWYGVSEEITRLLEQHAATGKRLKLLLIGNSITQGFGGAREAVSMKPGLAAMNAALGEGNWQTAGISRDRIQHIRWRIRHGNYNVARPEYVVITAGINNLGAGDPPQEVAAGLKALIYEAEEVFPDSRIVLLGPLPAGPEADSWFRRQGDEVHRLLARSRFGVRTVYLNPTEWFTQDNGKLQENLYVADHLHLSEEGYAVWTDYLMKIMEVH